MIAPRTDRLGAVIFDGDGPVGRALIAQLIERGAEVYLAWDSETAEATRNERPLPAHIADDYCEQERMAKFFEIARKRLGRIDLMIKCPKPIPRSAEKCSEAEANRLQWMERELMTLVNFLHLGKRSLVEHGGTLLAASHMLIGQADSDSESELVAAGGVAGSVVSAALDEGREEVRNLLFTIEDLKCEVMETEGAAWVWERNLKMFPAAPVGLHPALLADRLLDLVDEGQNWIADRTIEAFYRKEVLQ